MILKYNDIDQEIRSLGLTKKEVAIVLGCSISTLNYRIKQSKPTIHWAIYGLSNYYGKKNLIINDDR